MIREARALDKLFSQGIITEDSPNFRREKQPDGRIQLRLGTTPAPMQSGRAIPFDHILLWDANCPIEAQDLSGVHGVYNSMGGLTVHTHIDYTGNIDDYGVIIWLIAETDPVWLSQWKVNGLTWRGRIHLSAEWWPNYQPSVDYVNGLNFWHGMVVGHDATPGPIEQAVATSHPLAAGFDNLTHLFLYGATASISGGDDVFKVAPSLGGFAMMQQKRTGNVDWVLAGDSNHLTTLPIIPPPVYERNAQFLRNLLMSFPLV